MENLAARHGGTSRLFALPFRMFREGSVSLGCEGVSDESP